MPASIIAARHLYDDLRAACPNGIDVDFENVGGDVLDTALRLMNRHSRIVVCGLIAEYNLAEPYPHRRLRSILVNRIRMQGMIVFDWKDRYGEALAELARHLADGRLKYRESIVDGLDNAPRALIGLLNGENSEAAGRSDPRRRSPRRRRSFAATYTPRTSPRRPCRRRCTS
jgi:NADPH-dependent curcumin reductase CurA